MWLSHHHNDSDFGEISSCKQFSNYVRSVTFDDAVGDDDEVGLVLQGTPDYRFDFTEIISFIRPIYEYNSTILPF